MKNAIIIAAGIVILLVLAGPVLAQGDGDVTAENARGEGGLSAGIGVDWGGLGLNYIAMSEDSSTGLTIGVGTLFLGAGASAGLVFRSGDSEAIFAEGFYGGVAAGEVGAVGGGVTVEYGNLAVEGGEAVWRIGLAFAGSDNPIVPIIGFGVSF